MKVWYSHNTLCKVLREELKVVGGKLEFESLQNTKSKSSASKTN